MARFTGKVVLISGTGGRQGRVAALAFANEGAKVLGCDVNVERSAETTRLVTEAGGEMISAEPVDLANPADAERWVEIAASRWGRVDVLYNNAAGLAIAPFDNATLDHWDYTIRNELTLGYVAARAVWPHFLKQKKGVIISIASIAGHLELLHTFPCIAHGVANAGVQALARMLAAAGAVHGIRSVSISPGIVSNPKEPGAVGNPNTPTMKTLWETAAMGRPAEMDEIVKTAMFLASDDASYITGTDVAVDGGMSGILWRN
jgi:meso-butanediol dehydrogenase / (S,S)-butanediol dehydrogenase / diacetyl reductase